VSGSKKFPQFTKGGFTASLEVCPGAAMPFEIEVIVYGGLGRGELLQTSHPPETQHRPLAPEQ
jgi:hypothetical protein